MSMCCTGQARAHACERKFAVVGSPNVGKSVLFNYLTGLYTTVSNFPGTTVDVTRGLTVLGTSRCEIIDTPGLYSFMPVSEEEQVTIKILLEEKPSVIIHVVDTKNLERMLPLTLELIDTAIPVVLVLNMMDEARARKIEVNTDRLSQLLGVPVIPAVATSGEGLDALRAVLQGTFVNKNISHIRLEKAELNTAIDALSKFVPANATISPQAFSRLLLRDNTSAWSLLDKDSQEKARKAREELGPVADDYALEMAMSLRAAAVEIIKRVVVRPGPESKRAQQIRASLDRLTMNPLTGIPILAFILYWGLYRFVGEFGAGTVVNFIEADIFEEIINPWLVEAAGMLLPWQSARDLFVGQYGMLTLGVRYAVALILPIVSFFFIAFSLLEDSGYLPRLAMLLDRIFKKLGLSGRAVIPMVLGLGCATMATMVTRTLPTKRERVISAVLLSLAIPCSAQLGVILAVLGGSGKALLLWAGVMGVIFLTVGTLCAKLMPGEEPFFYMELPPLRWPKITNILTKTFVRVKWYFAEVFPIFILASALIWLGELTGGFQALIRLLESPVHLMGLPSEAAPMFLLGFFRRDYGAAGLYDLGQAGALSAAQLVVACVALTLFLPCIAQFLMNVKERGLKTGLVISGFTLFVSFAVAAALNLVLTLLPLSI